MPGILESDSDLQKIVFGARHVARVTALKATPTQVEVLWSSGKTETFRFVEVAEAEEFRAGLSRAMRIP